MCRSFILNYSQNVQGKSYEQVRPSGGDERPASCCCSIKTVAYLQKRQSHGFLFFFFFLHFCDQQTFYRGIYICHKKSLKFLIIISLCRKSLPGRGTFHSGRCGRETSTRLQCQDRPGLFWKFFVYTTCRIRNLIISCLSFNPQPFPQIKRY